MRRPPFPAGAIGWNGARGKGFGSPRNNRAPLTAPRRSEHVLRRGKGDLHKSWPIGHFFFARIGHSHFAATSRPNSLDSQNDVLIAFRQLGGWLSPSRLVGGLVKNSSQSHASFACRLFLIASICAFSA